MNHDELADSWGRTRKRLERAVALISVTGDGRVQLDSYRENLAHNELELALDGLEEAGNSTIQAPEFWEHLKRRLARIDHLRSCLFLSFHRLHLLHLVQVLLPGIDVL